MLFISGISRHYCDDPATSESAMLLNKTCPAGRFCPAGLRSLSDALNCDPAKYCPEGTSRVSWSFQIFSQNRNSGHSLSGSGIMVNKRLTKMAP